MKVLEYATLWHWRSKYHHSRPNMSVEIARRTNPKFAQSALFVEKLFDQPIHVGAKITYTNFHPLGVQPFAHYSGLAVVPKNCQFIQVHELIHLQDYAHNDFTLLKSWASKSGLEKLKSKFILEGRAVFGAQLFAGQFNRLTWYVTDPKYWTFHNSLCTMAKKIGDPIKAFKITTEKPPSWLGILFPTKFYAKEIEAAKSEAT